MLDIVIPTYGRPEKLAPLVANIASTVDEDFLISFVVEAGDIASQEAITKLGPGPHQAILLTQRGYPKAVNLGVRMTKAPWIAIINDDVRCHSGWWAHARAHADGACVLGTNDLSPSTANGDHATQPIVRRSYIEDPGGAYGLPGLVFAPDYWHNFCETELWQLAEHRGVARFVESSVVEHRHPDWEKAEMDATYERGAKQHWDDDAALFEKRRAQWLGS